MLKEYTLKVVVQVGGSDDADCDAKLAMFIEPFVDTWEITHEEVLHNEEVERE